MWISRAAAMCQRLVTNQRYSRRRNSLAVTILEQITDAVVVTDDLGEIKYVNRAFTEITGYRSEEVIGRNPSILQSGRQDAAFYAEMWWTIAKAGVWSGEIWNRRKSGEVYAGILTISAVLDTHGHIQCYIGIFSDISQLKRSERLIEELRRHDALTGLLNWDAVQGEIATAVQQTLKRGKSRIAVLMLGLDRFKDINGGLGYAEGDQVLKAVTERLVSAAGVGASIGHRGGDEFCILLTDVETEGCVQGRANRILDAVRQPISLHGLEVVVTASIGFGVFPRDGRDAQSLIRRADIAMRRAKRAGRSLIRSFDAQTDGDGLEQMSLWQDLRRAVEREEFMLQYQPQVDLRDGRIVGVEALVRWRHPELGMIPPTKFITLAEETGLIIDIGAWVLREACTQVRTWQVEGHDGLRVAINLSAVQFSQVDLEQQIGAALAVTGLAADSLELEITERMMMANPENAIEAMHRIKGLGVKFAVDDFGTGYSSLAYLKHFPIDILKIDRAFVGNCPHDRVDTALTEAIINLGRCLDLSVVAEGVATMEQCAFLLERGCGIAQGYLFSPPLDGRQLSSLLASGARLAVPVETMFG